MLKLFIYHCASSPIRLKIVILCIYILETKRCIYKLWTQENLYSYIQTSYIYIVIFSNLCITFFSYHVFFFEPISSTPGQWFHVF